MCETFLAQSRKGAKKTLRNAVALCAFAALRGRSFLQEPHLAADFDAITSLKFGIFDRSRLDLLNAVANCHEPALGAFA